MTARFDLEQQILDCWKITDDIPMMEEQGANVADMTSLACVYEYKFQRLWATFERMCVEEQPKIETPDPAPKLGSGVNFRPTYPDEE